LIGSWLMRSCSSVALTVGLSVATIVVMSFTSTEVDVVPGVIVGSITTRSATRIGNAPSNLCIPGDSANTLYDPGVTAGKM